MHDYTRKTLFIDAQGGPSARRKVGHAIAVLEWGMVNRLVPHDGLPPQVLALAS